ncbi:LADA_0D07866g1_1 [Lachancea dasiensis]|uniref:LADA_0D07866g1_1 n=1 Tax=Lachancea dasiensis TaxID=1072105 RepID=A0A1G4J6U7_9SACH|nr:LADA_0D07866g1_1 [Lachancea dasiensis]
MAPSINSDVSSLLSTTTAASPIARTASEKRQSDLEDATQKMMRKISSRMPTSVYSMRHGDDDDDDDDDYESEDLDELLENQFEIEDAFRVKTNRLAEESSVHPSQTSVPLHGQDTQHSVVQKVFTNQTTGDLSLPPDGGYGWVCCICLTMIYFSTWGISAASGIFLAFYLNSDSFPGATKYDYAIIAGLNAFGAQALGPSSMITSRIFGLKLTMYAGVVVLFLGFFLASFATKLWQLYLTQGFLFGVGIAMVFVPATTILPGWFLKKRSTAFGISLLGTGAGGVIYSVAIQQMIDRTGDQRWALRMLAIAGAATCAVATFFMRQRIPTKPSGLKSWIAIKQQFQLIYQWRVVKTYKINLISLWCALALFGYNLMVFTMSAYGVSKGLSSQQASLLTIALNSAQCVGRPSIGLLGDRFGRVNVTVALSTLLTIFLFGFWIPSHTFIQLIMLCICLGLIIGVANVMNIVLIADVSGADDFLPAWGYCNMFTAPFLLVSELIAQALVDENNKVNPYLYTQIFTGLCFFVALLLVLLLREITVKIRFKASLSRIEKLLTDLELDDDKSVSRSTRDQLESQRQECLEYLQPGIGTFFRRVFCKTKI